MIALPVTIRVEGSVDDLTTESEPVLTLARFMCHAPTERPCYQCRQLAWRVLLLGDVRIDPQREEGSP